MNEEARLNVQIPQEQHDRLNKLLPWGIKSSLVRALLDMLERSMVKNGIETAIHVINGNADIVIRRDVSKFETPDDGTASRL